MIARLPIHAVITLAVVATFVLVQCARSQDLADGSTGNRKSHHALIVVGIPGDAEHEDRFCTTTESLRQWLDELGFLEDQVTILFGGSELRPSGAYPATKEDVKRAIGDVVAAIQPDDTLWLITLGHANYDGQRTWFHLPGPDISDVELADWCADIECREQVFWLTHACSGSYLKPLSRSGRVVITATAAGNEGNETEFPHALVNVAQKDLEAVDQDGDHRVTLVELFRAISGDVEARFAADNRVPTEHAQLDDNGDGRGTEAADLPPIAESRLEGKIPSQPPDGAVADRIAIEWPSQVKPDQETEASKQPQ